MSFGASRTSPGRLHSMSLVFLSDVGFRVPFWCAQGSKGTLQWPEPGSVDAPPPKLDLEHEFMDNEDFLMSSCNLGMEGEEEDDDPVDSAQGQPGP